MNNGDKPAFKKIIIEDPRGANFCQESFGLTKREYFAAMAMQGLVTKEGWSERFAEENSEKSLIKYIAYASVKMADELLKELEL